MSASEPPSQSAQRLTACYMGAATDTEDRILMKRIGLTEGTGMPASVLKETFYLKKLRSSHVRELRDVVLTPTHVYMVSSYHGPTLFEAVVARPDSLNAQEVLKIAYSLLKALHFVHRRGVAHLALDPDCVVLEPPNVRIDGFCYSQMSEIQPGNRSNDFHFNAYSAPELLTPNQSLTTAADMWSFAQILIVLLTRRLLPPVLSKSHLQDLISHYFPNGQTQASDERLREKIPNIDNSCIDLLRKLLTDAPLRLSAWGAMQHAYFNSLRSEDEE